MAFRGKKFSAIKISPILGKWHLGEIFQKNGSWPRLGKLYELP
jgi:hypothetical protein